VDPKALEYLNQGSYVFAGNNPVKYIDLNGEEQVSFDEMLTEIDPKVQEKIGFDSGKGTPENPVEGKVFEVVSEDPNHPKLNESKNNFFLIFLEPDSNTPNLKESERNAIYELTIASLREMGIEKAYNVVPLTIENESKFDISKLANYDSITIFGNTKSLNKLPLEKIDPRKGSYARGIINDPKGLGVSISYYKDLGLYELNIGAGLVNTEHLNKSKIKNSDSKIYGDDNYDKIAILTLSGLHEGIGHFHVKGGHYGDFYFEGGGEGINIMVSFKSGFPAFPKVTDSIFQFDSNSLNIIKSHLNHYKK